MPTKENLDFNKEAGTVAFKNPLSKDVTKLGDSQGQVTAMTTRGESLLEKSPGVYYND